MYDEADALPGSIRAVVPHPFGGSVVMSGFPGLETSIDGSAVFDPDMCRETVQGLYDLGARTLIVLVEPDELDQAGFDLLAQTCAAVGVGIDPHPIVDYSVPDDAMFAWWQDASTARAALLGAGGALAVCCQYGAGRSGLLAALSLMDAGIAADDAIATVRGQFGDAVESAEQEAWLETKCPVKSTR